MTSPAGLLLAQGPTLTCSPCTLIVGHNDRNGFGAESGERLTVFAPPMEAAHGEGSLGLPRLSVPGAARTGQVLSRWTTQSPGTEILAIPYVYVVQSRGTDPGWLVLRAADAVVADHDPSTAQTITNAAVVVPIRFAFIGPALRTAVDPQTLPSRQGMTTNETKWFRSLVRCNVGVVSCVRGKPTARRTRALSSAHGPRRSPDPSGRLPPTPEREATARTVGPRVDTRCGSATSGHRSSQGHRRAGRPRPR